MGKKAAKRPSVPDSLPGRGVKAGACLALVCALFFWAVCVSSAATVKYTALVLTALTLCFAFLFFSRLRDRTGVPLLLLAATVLMGGVSTLYAVSGKFALYEFLKLLSAFCLVLLLLAVAPERDPGRWIAKILAGFSAFSGLVSIDMLSTRLLSGAVLGFLGRFSQDYAGLPGLEAGTRMTSLFENPNVFAGIAGLGVLLSLILVTSSGSRSERAVQTAVLFVNALSFLLAFSMGASGAIALAFVSCLALERKGRRAQLLILMAETLLLTVLSAAVISLTSFDLWTGPRPIPLLTAVLGAAALCALDGLLGGRIAGALAKRPRVLSGIAAAVLVLAAGFAVAACLLTGGVTLEPAGSLRRAAYPDGGDSVLSVRADGPLTVTVESQDRRDTMMHTSSLLYTGPAEGAAFRVPEESLVVYFTFTAPEGAVLDSVSYTGDGGSGSIPLGYKLLPGFVANRLQGLRANENAIQRLVFFADGLKLFRRSPLIGLGLGAFENGVKSVQSFGYVTRYAHNHYIQTLAETGVVGLLLFLALLGGSAAAVLSERRRGADAHPLTPALGAALVFMAVHAGVEVVFSSYPYLPVAFGVFGLVSLCCGRSLKKPALGKTGRTASLLSVCALLAVYALLLVFNLHANALVVSNTTYDSLEKAISLDKFEWADYALSYVTSAGGTEVDERIRARADEYAARLERVDSNSVPIYLAEYYFETGRTDRAMEMTVKYVDYVSSDQSAWQRAFDLMLANEEDTEVYRDGVLAAADRLERWNAENMGQIVLSADAQDLIERARRR